MSRGLIFTADFQAQHENLDVLKRVIDEMYEYGEKRNAVGYVWLGDTKETYHPLDGRVLNFVVETIHRLRTVFILLGNHNRFGLHSDEESWLTTLGKAGAHVYTKESSVIIGGFVLHMLPFRSDSAETRKMSDHLYRERRRDAGSGDSKCHILCFHCQLKESDVQMNTAGVVWVDDLHPKAYDYVLGGHVHRHQKIKYNHVWYVGSPFAATWGNVNQEKGYVYIEP